MPQSVAVRLADAKLLLTGASGFLGKAVLATWLREVPGSGTITLLLRAPDDDAAHERLVEQVLTSEPFAGGLADEALASGRLRALAADLAAEGLGGLDSQELAGTDVAIHCAASVSFEQPMDDILELNVLGARRLSDALREAGCDDVHLLHVSTAYAAGQRTGLVLERPYGSGTSEPWVDLDAELAVAKEWRRELESQSRLPEQQKRFVADAQEELGPAGAPARRPARGVGPPRLDVERARRARASARAGARLVGHLHALQGARRAGARAEPAAAPHDRPPDDHRVRARAALPGLDRGAEGHRPGAARLRPRAHPPVPRPPVGTDRHRARRPRRPRPRGRRGRPADGRPALPHHGQRRPQPAAHRRARADHHPLLPVAPAARRGRRPRRGRRVALRLAREHPPGAGPRRAGARHGPQDPRPRGAAQQRRRRAQPAQAAPLARAPAPPDGDLRPVHGARLRVRRPRDPRARRPDERGGPHAPPVRHGGDRLGDVHGGRAPAGAAAPGLGAPSRPQHRGARPHAAARRGPAGDRVLRRRGRRARRDDRARLRVAAHARHAAPRP